MSKKSSSKSYREVSRMLAIGDECFEDEVRRLVSTHLVNTCTFQCNFHKLVNLDLDMDYFTLQGISTQHLNPMQVLTAIQSAQLRMGYEFTESDFLEGKVGALMKPEDFNFEENVSTIVTVVDSTTSVHTTLIPNRSFTNVVYCYWFQYY